MQFHWIILLLLSFRLFSTNLSAQTNFISFENLPSIGFVGGTMVTEEAKLNTQFLSLGITFSSTPGYAAVVNLGQGHAYLGVNGIGGVDASGKLDYAQPIEVTFHQPNSPEIPDTMTYVAFRTDRLTEGGILTIKAYDTNGALIRQVPGRDTLQQLNSISIPGIHKVVIQGNSSTAFDLFYFGRTDTNHNLVHFEDMPSMRFVDGPQVPEEARLTNQWRKQGVLFSSPAGYAATVNLGVNHATSGALGIAGVNAAGERTFGEDGPITIQFINPEDPYMKATTDEVQISVDRVHNGSGEITMSAFNAEGALLETVSILDTAEQPFLRIEKPGIHKLEIQGNGSTAFDDLFFGRLTYLPPKLLINKTEQGIRLTWLMNPRWAPEKSKLDSNPLNWETITTGWNLVDGYNVLDLPSTEHAQFFRLKRMPIRTAP